MFQNQYFAHASLRFGAARHDKRFVLIKQIPSKSNLGRTQSTIIQHDTKNGPKDILFKWNLQTSHEQWTAKETILCQNVLFVLFVDKAVYHFAPSRVRHVRHYMCGK